MRKFVYGNIKYYLILLEICSCCIWTTTVYEWFGTNIKSFHAVKEEAMLDEDEGRSKYVVKNTKKFDWKQNMFRLSSDTVASFDKPLFYHDH